MRITIDGPGAGAVTETQEASGTVTPFTLTSLISQPRTPLTKYSAITVPPAQTRIVLLNEQRLTQPRGTRHRVDSEGRDTLAETVQRLQERVAYLEGRSSGERVRERRQQRTSSPNQSEATFCSEDTSDPPPTYKS